MDSTMELMDAGLDCLIENLGIIDTEKFIAVIKKENFDYTSWQREYFDGLEPGKFSEEAVIYAGKHPHKGNGRRL